MDSSSHLEKMGRELKCPICLSLLNSAVSLTCNHVFCNLCIEKSMKSASDCPVCKVPYRRREVRPAPHMDNLVSIYKSMEVASGVNIFATQPEPSNKLSENQPEADMVCGNDKTCSETPDPQNQRKLKQYYSKGSSKSNIKNSSLDPVRPSFPTKKRVQVPQHPIPETPTQVTKPEVSLEEHTKNESWRSLVVQKEMPVLNKDNLEFHPFFWLQEEEDADKHSQPTDGDLVMETPPDVPCFSDIKDSDDELQCNMNPENGPIASQNADLFDSEMFEWTQRACSPELCSSSMKIQVETHQYEGIAENEDKPAANDTAKDMADEPYSTEGFFSQKGPNRMVLDLATSACPGMRYMGNEQRTTRPSKRSKKPSESNQHKQAKRMKGAEDITREEKLDKIGNLGNSSNLKDGNKVIKCLDPSTTAIMPNSDSTLANKAKSLNKGSRPMLLVDLSTSLDDKDGISGSQTVKKASESNQNKRRKRTRGVCIDSNELAKDQDKCDNIGKPGNTSNLKVKPNKRAKKVCRDPRATDTMPESQRNTPMLLVDLSVSLDDKEGISGSQDLKSTDKDRNTIVQQQRDCTRRSKTRKLNTALDIFVPCQSKNVLISDLPKSITIDCDHQVSDLGAEDRENDIESKMDSKSGKKLKHSKKVKFGTADNSNVAALSNSQSIQNSTKETQLFGKLQLHGSSDDSSRMEKTRPILNGILRKCEKNSNKIQCSFCQSIEDSEASGVMVHYLNNKPVTVDYDGANVVHVHRNCAEWAPNVYFEDDMAINLEAELARSRRIKCGCCGLKGAALGCYEKSCRKSFHVPCAKLTPQCRWDNDNFVMLCPLHASLKLPNEISGSQTKQKEKCLPRRQPSIHQSKGVGKLDSSTSSVWNSHGLLEKLALCCSTLTIAEKVSVSEFERLSGVKVLKNWDSSVTHVIASTDENGACRRTLKFLMGILEGKWILSIEWVKACVKAMEYVDEQRYEIDVDIHGIRDGPRHGRLRLLNKQPKIFGGYKFYFAGDFQHSYKGYLHDLIIAAGGTVLHRKPISGDSEALSSTFVIYNLELPDKCKEGSRNLILNRRRSDAENLATSCHAVVATNSWILNSIAACKLQNLAD